MAQKQGGGSGTRSGLVMGKWRFGPHYGHIPLFEAAKAALGNGELIVGVESQASIWTRRGVDHQVLPDEQRLAQIAALEAVDYAVLLDPNEGERQNLNGYYEGVWRQLNPDIVFIGTEDYQWRKVYEDREKRFGTLLLWQFPTAPYSTSELLSYIAGGSA